MYVLITLYALKQIQSIYTHHGYHDFYVSSVKENTVSRRSCIKTFFFLLKLICFIIKVTMKVDKQAKFIANTILYVYGK